MGLIVGGRLQPFRLRLRAPLATARGAIGLREGVLLVLQVEDGTRGFGEASPIPGFACFAHEDAKTSGDVLARLLGGLRGARSEDREALLERAEALAPAAPAARFALDTALADLEARGAGLPLADWLAGGAARRRQVPVNALVSAGTPDAVYEAGLRAAARGFDTVKLKLGARDAARDRARVAALREAVGAGVRIRLDANAGLIAARACDVLEDLAAFAIEYVEDPIAVASVSDVETLACLRARAPIAIAADESASSPALVREIVAQAAADLLVIKPAALGGLRAARRLDAAARARGLGTVVTSGLEAAVGLAAALHLAASLDGPLPACGLATAELLETDLAPVPEPVRGVIALPSGPGLGIVPEMGVARKGASAPFPEEPSACPEEPSASQALRGVAFRGSS